MSISEEEKGPPLAFHIPQTRAAGRQPGGSRSGRQAKGRALCPPAALQLLRQAEEGAAGNRGGAYKSQGFHPTLAPSLPPYFLKPARTRPLSESPGGWDSRFPPVSEEEMGGLSFKAHSSAVFV